MVKGYNLPPQAKILALCWPISNSLTNIKLHILNKNLLFPYFFTPPKNSNPPFYMDIYKAFLEKLDPPLKTGMDHIMSLFPLKSLQVPTCSTKYFLSLSISSSPPWEHNSITRYIFWGNKRVFYTNYHN